MATARTKMLQLRLRPRQLTEWKRAARSADQTLSEWIREACEMKRQRTKDDIVETAVGKLSTKAANKGRP